MIHKKIEIKARGMEAVGNLYTYFLDSSIEMRPNENVRYPDVPGRRLRNDGLWTDGHAVSCYGLSCCYFAL